MKKTLLLTISLIIAFISFAQKENKGVVTLKVKSEFKSYCQNESIDLEPFRNLFEKYGITKVERMFPHISTKNKISLNSDITLLYKIYYSSETNQKILIDHLYRLNYFEYIEKSYLHQLLYSPNDPGSSSMFGSQDYLTMHKVYQAWDITKGDSTILVAISDDGINLNHIDLQKTIYKNIHDTIDGIDNDNDGFIDNYLGYNLINGNNNLSGTGGHGTSVAGCVSADTDNGIGIAGVGFNTKIVPLKAIGNTFKGYESIVFAANKGYDIINLSWGCTGCFTQTNQDIINYAVLDKNMIVVAAGGNTDADIFWYPASYDNVLSVSGLDGNFKKGAGISWNYNIDIAAKGVSVFTTASSGGYLGVNGSSFAAPLVSGGAALVKSVFPHYSAQQIMEQLRVTTDSMYHIGSNSAYKDKLGKGSLNLFRAVTDSTTPAIRNQTNYLETDNMYQNGDTVFIKGDFKNFLNPTKNLKIELSSSSIYVQLLDSLIDVGVLKTLNTFTNSSNLFSFRIINNPSLNAKIWLKFSYNDTNYVDFEYKYITVNQNFLNIYENEISLTVTNTGNIGNNLFRTSQGIGFSYKNAKHILYECGLIVASDSIKISNNLKKNPVTLSQKFFPIQNIQEVNSGSFSDFKATTEFADTTHVGDYAGVNIVQNIYAWNNPPNDKYIIFEYEITNATLDTVQNMYAGIFADWNINFNGLDKAAWNHNKGFGYVYDAEKLNTYAGIKPLMPYYGTYCAIENEATTSTSLEIIDNFSDTEKFKTLSSIGTGQITAGENYPKGAGDVSHTVGNNVGKLLPNQTKVVAFALMAGDSIQDLEQAAYQAQLKYGKSIVLSSTTPIVSDTTICEKTTANLNALGGTKYSIYYSKDDYLVMDTILPHKTPTLTDTTQFYISFRDSSTLPSLKAALTVNTYRPEVQIAFSPDTLFLLDETEVQLQNISPSYSTWEWKYFDTLLNNSYNPKINLDAEGVYFATLSITDANNCFNFKSDSFVVINAAKPIIGNIKTENNAGFKVYPIPASQKIIIEQSKAILSPIEIYNNVGQKIYSENTILNKTIIDISTFPNGFYTVKLNTQIIKIIKK